MNLFWISDREKKKKNNCYRKIVTCPPNFDTRFAGLARLGSDTRVSSLNIDEPVESRKFRVGSFDVAESEVSESRMMLQNDTAVSTSTVAGTKKPIFFLFNKSCFKILV